MAAVLGVSAALSPLLGRVIGLKFTVAASLAAIAGGLWQISAVSAVTTTYRDVVPGLLLVGLGAGLLLPTATNSVVGSVPQGDSGMGSASNAVALQVGGALGVAVIGSVLSTRYQDHMTTALAGRHLPAAATQAILGSLGGALAVAARAGGAAGALLAHAARAAFMSGNQIALAVGAAVALGGVVLVLARLPLRVSRDSPDPQRRHGEHRAIAERSCHDGNQKGCRPDGRSQTQPSTFVPTGTPPLVSICRYPEVAMAVEAGITACSPGPR